MLDLVGDDLVVIANTGDDIEIYGAYVSPDPDLVTFWLADRIDERGWGLAGDTFAVVDGLRELGVDVWFKLGDRDLAIGLERARRLDDGERLTEAHAAITGALGVGARVLPMSDRPVRTWVRAHGRAWPFQEFMIRAAGKGPIEDVDLRGVRSAPPSDEVLEAIATAAAIVIGPSNPIVSIGPILALPGLCEALASSPAPVVAVSPFVSGAVLKGPTKEFMASSELSPDAEGIAVAYEGVIDGLVADDRTDRIPLLHTDVLMADGAGRRRVAEETLRFAQALG
jgi:LPPG:FO 2-phospho-L-lactate transferase